MTILQSYPTVRDFIILPKVQEFELDLIEAILGEPLALHVREYIKRYGGASILERYFIDNKGLKWELSQFNLFKDLYGLTKEFQREYQRKLFPFAYDPGGWHFCLSFDDTDYGKIIINRWTDYPREEQFLVIAESFTEFINGLSTEG